MDWARSRGTSPDYAPAMRVLPPPLVELFDRMPEVDRRHGLRMLHAVVALLEHGSDSNERGSEPLRTTSGISTGSSGQATPGASPEPTIESLARENQPLLQAALIHDVGKAEAGVGLHHRVLRVLMSTWLKPLWRRLAAWPTGLRRPFWVMANHPARGAVWVESRGGSPELCALIRYHEAHPPPEWNATLRHWHAVLTAADARN